MLFVDAVRELRKDGVVVKPSIIKKPHRLYMVWEEDSDIPPMYCTAQAISAMCASDKYSITQKKEEEDDDEHEVDFDEAFDNMWGFC